MLRLKKVEGLKKKAFTVNKENIKQKIAMQVTFILEKKLPKQIFYQNLFIFLATYASNLNPFWDRNVHPYVFTLKGRNMKEATGMQMTFMLEIKTQKYNFSKFSAILQPLMCTL